jgi:predicted dehydrogenase
MKPDAPASSRPVRLGVIGMGQRTVHHGWDGDIKQAGAEGGAFRIAAVCDCQPDRLAKGIEFLQEHVGIKAQGFADYRAMIRDAGLEAVYVASPNHLHREMTEACFEAGLDVLCEKPMATTLADADAMIASRRKHGRVLGFAMQMRYRRRYHRVAELIREGRIGAPAMVWCTEFRPPFAALIKNWVWEKAKSGGALVEKNCHHTDILDLFAGGKPTRVYATGGQRKHAVMAGVRSEIVDHAWVTWDYDNGARGMIGISFLQEPAHVREFGVAGAEGMIRFDLTDGEKIHLRPNGAPEEVIDCPGELRGGVLADFCRCVRTREQPLVTPELARAALLVPLAAELSIEQKRVVEIAELG